MTKLARRDTYRKYKDRDKLTLGFCPACGQRLTDPARLEAMRKLRSLSPQGFADYLADGLEAMLDEARAP